jgi:hypothetical protein
MQFAVVWFRCAILRNTFAYEVSHVSGLLKQRTKIIMTRTFGNLKNANSLTQHLNPAARVARQYPHLPISRLLLSINDVDVPVANGSPRWFFQYFSCLNVYWPIRNAFEASASLPTAAQDSLTEVTGTVLTNAVIIVLYIIGESSPILAGALAFLLLCLIFRTMVLRLLGWLARLLVRAAVAFWVWLLSKLLPQPEIDMFADEKEEEEQEQEKQQQQQQEQQRQGVGKMDELDQVPASRPSLKKSTDNAAQVRVAPRLVVPTVEVRPDNLIQPFSGIPSSMPMPFPALQPQFYGGDRAVTPQDQFNDSKPLGSPPRTVLP